MKIKKEIISDGELFLSSKIKLIYEDGSNYIINCTQSKVNNTVDYTLYMSENKNDITNIYEEIVKLFEQVYGIKIFTLYFEDSNQLSSSFQLGDYDFDFIYDMDFSIISLVSKGEVKDSSFADDLAVYGTCNLLELLSKKTLGSVK